MGGLKWSQKIGHQKVKIERYGGWVGQKSSKIVGHHLWMIPKEDCENVCGLFRKATLLKFVDNSITKIRNIYQIFTNKDFITITYQSSSRIRCVLFKFLIFEQSYKFNTRWPTVNPRTSLEQSILNYKMHLFHADWH